MRVALLSPLSESVPPRLYGGTERVVYNLCRGLTEADVEVTLFASGDSSAEGKLVPVIDEATRLKAPPVADPIAYNLKMLAEVAARAHEFDVIHNHHDYWMLPLSCLESAPLLTTWHGRLDAPELPIALQSYPRTYHISISDHQRRAIEERGRSIRWLRTIRHGIPVEDFEFHPQPGSYLAFLGRIDPQKRPDWAIQIAKQAGIPLKLAAKIEGEAMQSYFDAAIRPHLDGRNVEYVGEISESEKSEFLGGALALVFPIDWPEPFGLVTIEALACGTPVLARPCGAVPEILSDGVTGFISPDLTELARGAGEIARISRRGCREWVEKHFSLQRMTEDYLHVYRHLVDFAGSRSRNSAGWGPSGHRRNLLSPVERAADGNPESYL